MVIVSGIQPQPVLAGWRADFCLGLRDLGWSHPPGFNRRPADYESAALPAELGWLAFGYNVLRATERVGSSICARRPLTLPLPLSCATTSPLLHLVRRVQSIDRFILSSGWTLCVRGQCPKLCVEGSRVVGYFQIVFLGEICLCFTRSHAANVSASSGVLVAFPRTISTAFMGFVPQCCANQSNAA